MADRGKTWSNEEVSALIAAWLDKSIQRELNTMVRNEIPFRTISERLEQQGIHRSFKQCRNKMNQLKRKYKDKVDSLRKSGVGVDSDDEADIFVNFKWFHEIHAVMGSRAVVNPPSLLQSSDTDTHLEPPRDGGSEEVSAENNSDPQTPTTISIASSGFSQTVVTSTTSQTAILRSMTTVTTPSVTSEASVISESDNPGTPSSTATTNGTLHMVTDTPDPASHANTSMPSTSNTDTPVNTRAGTTQAPSRHQGTYQPPRKQKKPYLAIVFKTIPLTPSCINSYFSITII